MFGPKTTFGSTTTGGFGTFGSTTTTNSPFGNAPAFGQPQQQQQQQQQQQSAFGSSAFGATNPGSGGGLFGSNPTSMGGGLFGGAAAPATSTPSFGGFGATAPGSSAFGAFKPAGSAFGSPSVTSSGGLFGTTTSQPTNTGLFGGGSSMGFGAAQTPFGTATTAFGQPQASVVGTTVKFNPLTGTDTMMKSGGQQSINTRHQCITCMKEYENKSLEELRFEDYSANRKGPSAGSTIGGGGLFGSTMPSTGLFGAQPQQQTQSGGLFGQPSKPLFGTATTSAFGMSTASPFNTATSAFGATSTAGSTGLFGSKPAGFGTTTTPSTSFGFNQTSTSAGGLFGQQQKPFGAAAPQPQGGLFGTPAPTFGSTTAPAFGSTATTGTFGQPPPNQQIGLFGQPANKPTTFGAPFGVQATTAGPTFGFGAATTTQTNPFGNQNKPTFSFGAPTGAAPAFGAPTSTPAFGVAQPQGGLFGATSKPSFGFSTTPQPSTAFGTTSAFNPSGGGIFGNAQQKPGGIFGNTSAFGTSTSTPLSTGFGASTGGFGASTGTSFGFGLQQQQPFQQQAQQPQQPQPVIQQQLELLSHIPYGQNPLFKNPFSDGKKCEELLKPTNPAAQKALSANQYKVSPLRNVKAKPKPISGGQHKSVIFEGLDEDDEQTATKGSGGEMFVPRRSIKKLIINPKSPGGGSGVRPDNLCTSLNLSHNDSSLTGANNSANLSMEDSMNKQNEDSLILPSVPSHEDPNKSSNVVDDSFSALLSRKKPTSTNLSADSSKDQQKSHNVTTESTGGNSEIDDEMDEIPPHPAGIKLKRPSYYTIPSFSELVHLTDPDGNCPVENFTIGRTGYGNIFFPGVINIRNMNFDEIVFFHRKEVIVYPDDEKKPPLGEGLNRRAQVTLDKVWPINKNKQEVIKSPEMLSQLNYEEKLQKACIKLGARFIEYRPETGSWVFRVEHFSKYGLEDSDEEEDVANLLARKDVKKLKVTTTAAAPPVVKASTAVQPAAKTQNDSEINFQSDGKVGGADVSMSPMQDSGSDSMLHLARISGPHSKVQMMKAALFQNQKDFDGDEMEMDATPSIFEISKSVAESSRPIILQPRPTILERRDKFIEDIAHSMLTGNRSKGLGGSFSLEPNLLSSSLLLRSQYLSQSGMAANTSSATPSGGKTASSKLTRYTLHGGYNKYIALPNSEMGDAVLPPVAPHHAGRLLPLSEAILGQDRLSDLADAALFMGRSFRVGWGVDWSLANSGTSLSNSILEESRGSVSVAVENVGVTSFGGVDEEQLNGLESWLSTYLNFTDLVVEDGVPKAIVQEGQDGLHAHSDQATDLLASSDSDNQSYSRFLLECQQVWDLCVALWGKMGIENDEDDDEEVRRRDSHEMTMRRRDALSNWLQNVVRSSVEEKVRKAQTSGDHIDQVLALLSGNQVREACDKAQKANDHYAIMLALQSSGNNSCVGQLTLQQLDRWQESKADKFIANNRLALYSLAAGVPVWPGSRGEINTCKNIDWIRCFALHLWYFTSPSASIADALEAYEEAFQSGDSQFGVYAAAPKPNYAINDDGSPVFDIKYHLLKLYANRMHPIESVITPVTHTPDHLDHRLGWFVAQILRSLGYRHLAEVKRDQHHLEFAAQLETLGLWNWSIFVLLHLSDSQHRRSAIKDVLCRHIKLSDHESSEKEIFLQDRLEIPQTWIAEAKAMCAATNREYGFQAWYLIKAELYTEAHEVISKWIAPDAIINDDCQYLYDLLDDLSKPEICKQILNWNVSGKLFYDFINVDREVEKLVNERDETSVGFRIEQLKPEILSLCSRVGSYNVTSAKERLCQSEISKKIAHLLRAVLSLDSNQDISALAIYLGQLPLPDDYELQELRTLNRSYIRERMDTV